MTLMEFFGCSFIAFGPPLAMFCLLVAKDPIRIIILISSSFFWLLSLLLSSILWSVVIPLKEYIVFGVVFSIIFQEIFRYLFYLLIRKAEIGLEKVSEVGRSGPTVKMSSSRIQLAFVSGLGFGLMSGAFSFVNILADSTGPGTVGLKGDSQYFFISSALTTLAFILLHTFWGVMFFKACDKKNYLHIAYVVISHFCASGLTFFNPHQYYLFSIIPIYVITLVTSMLAFNSAGGKSNVLTSLFSRSS